MELAYLFWHHRHHAASEEKYRHGLLQFHESLATQPPQGFISSFSRRYARVPWLDAKVEVYEDWYIVDGFSGLDEFTKGAENGTAELQNDSMSEMIEKGTGGIYRLLSNHGSEHALKTVVWFDKPSMRNTEDFVQSLEAKTEDAGGILWRRQMSLGPGKEFVIWLSSDNSFLIDEGLQFPFNRI